MSAAAEDPSSPLHTHFTWDDSEAARKYRLAQAGALIRRVKLTVVKPYAEIKTVKATVTRAPEHEVGTVNVYQSLPSMRHPEGGYEDVATILSTPGKRDELLRQVLGDLKALRRKYSLLMELKDIWAAVDDAIAESDLNLSPAGRGMAGQAGVAATV